jgi:hypothetical protein
MPKEKQKNRILGNRFRNAMFEWFLFYYWIFFAAK